MNKKLIPVGLSNRHVHLSKEHIDILFGEGHQLNIFKDLSQPGQYAADEKIEAVGPKGSLSMRVLGPARGNTQIEISMADGFVLGVKAPVRNSGDVKNSPGAKLVGPKGEVVITEGIVVAARHVHMHTSEGEAFGVKDKEIISMKVEGPRGLIFNNVLCRVHDTYALEFHVDVEEGNAAGLKNGDMVELIK